MEIQSNEYYTLPWIIGYSRSGSHWINCALEVYANRRRLYRVGKDVFETDPISVLPNGVPRQDYLWVHAVFEMRTSERPAKTAIILRDPVDAMYSLSRVMGVMTDLDRTKFLSDRFDRFKHFMYRWCMTNGKADADLIVRYENFLTEPAQEFKKLTDFLQLPWDEAKALDVLSKTTKGVLAKNAKNMQSHFHVGLESADYQAERTRFRERFGEFVYANTLRQGVDKFFTPKG